jgi:hypothetical protein
MKLKLNKIIIIRFILILVTFFILSAGTTFSNDLL